MEANRVQVSFAAPAQLTSSELWSQVKSSLEAQFPVRTLYWKSATRPSIRTIQTLEVDLVPFEAIKEESASQIPLSLLDKPLVNLFIVTCEDNELYKATVKRQIKEWNTIVTSRKNQEWLIVYVQTPDARPATSSLLKMRGTILDRIRADFNVDKRDRCSQLVLQGDLSSPKAWADVMSKIKDGIMSAFDLAVAQREEDVKRLEAQRQMPGWNFCTFFLLKESLAISLEGVNLLEDALIQYEELEASFAAVLNDPTSIWFGKFVDPSPNDDSLPILSVTKKPYRDLILANTISVFDFRIYIVAREAVLLGKSGFPDRILRKVIRFLSALGACLTSYQKELPDYFIESWIYSSALSAIDNCEAWNPEDVDSPRVVKFCSAKGEALELARLQLDKLGISRQYLPDKPPFSFSVPPEVVPSTTSAHITNKDLVKCLSDANYFYSLYAKLSNQAIDAYVKAGRRKFALRLHGSLAALDLHRERFATALQVYTSLPAHYATHQWTSLEAFMRLRGINHADNVKDDDHRTLAASAMSFLDAWVSDSRIELLDNVPDLDAFVSTLVAKLFELSRVLKEDLIVQNNAIFKFEIVDSLAKCLNGRDGYAIDISVQNRLSCDVALDQVTLSLLGQESIVLKFVANTCVVKPGRFNLQLICDSPSPGCFLPQTFDARIGKLRLSWPLKPKEPLRVSRMQEIASQLRMITLPVDEHAVRVTLLRPKYVNIGKTPQFLVHFSTGRNEIRKALIQLQSSDVNINLAAGETNESGVVFAGNEITVVDLGRASTVTCLIPYRNALGKPTVKVVIHAEFVTSDEPELTRSLKVVSYLTVTQPLAVTVKDFFRGQSLFSSFLLSTVSDQRVCIASVSLTPTEEFRDAVEISRSASTDRPFVTISPSHPATYMFRVQRLQEVKEALQLCIKYRTLQKVEQANVVDCQPEFTSSQHEFPVRHLYVGSAPASKSSDNEIKDWRTFIIPVDLPQIDLLAAASIYVAQNPFSKQQSTRRGDLFAGQPFSAVISMNLSCYWSGHEGSTKRRYRLRFEVDEMIRDWLVSGQKRGEFFAEDGTIHAVSITLMALRHGEIPLPKVNVTLLSSGEDTSHRSSPPLTLECYQVRGAEKLLILPRGGKTTFVVNVGSASSDIDPLDD